MIRLSKTFLFSQSYFYYLQRLIWQQTKACFELKELRKTMFRLSSRSHSHQKFDLHEHLGVSKKGTEDQTNLVNILSKQTIAQGFLQGVNKVVHFTRFSQHTLAFLTNAYEKTNIFTWRYTLLESPRKSLEERILHEIEVIVL